MTIQTFVQTGDIRKGHKMNDKYFPENIKEVDEPYEIDKDAPKWHTGQSYVDKPATQIKCSICGSDKFHVAENEHDYWTGIKCVNCEWESMIHDG